MTGNVCSLTFVSTDRKEVSTTDVLHTPSPVLKRRFSQSDVITRCFCGHHFRIHLAWLVGYHRTYMSDQSCSLSVSCKNFLYDSLDSWHLTYITCLERAQGSNVVQYIV